MKLKMRAYWEPTRSFAQWFWFCCCRDFNYAAKEDAGQTALAIFQWLLLYGSYFVSCNDGGKRVLLWHDLKRFLLWERVSLLSIRVIVYFHAFSRICSITDIRVSNPHCFLTFCRDWNRMQTAIWALLVWLQLSTLVSLVSAYFFGSVLLSLTAVVCAGWCYICKYWGTCVLDIL